MKFGKYLISNETEEWKEYYLDYDKLKQLIKRLCALQLGEAESSEIGTSLSVPRPTNAAGVPLKKEAPKEGDEVPLTQENFYIVLESEMKKIEQFTKKIVTEIRSNLKEIEAQLNGSELDEATIENIQNRVDTVAETFLNLEKYVNLNFTGFHKILKKHDKRLPNPCKAFYIARLHEQSWVRGDYSDVIVTMSGIYSILRGDKSMKAQETEKQDFVRSTTKYWVHTENISAVKCIILQHLPVFLQESMAGETDAQLVNSVYLDNRAMELYRGRLDKTFGAIALRLRWYGTPTPGLVFVERKTHQDSWTGEVSVKERFIINEKQVPDVLNGTFDVDAEIARMRAKGKSEDDIREWSILVTEILQAINSKQLEPTMRTQYMRTAFQVPFDATVRVSLDTNLCMIVERTEDVVRGDRWYRDPSVPVPKNEITRFPHAVLEVKLQLEDENSIPAWVTELIESDLVMQVHKFSKFIHGCATLMPDEVTAFPYWIDDASLKASLKNSPAAELLEESKGANQYYSHLLPHDANGKQKLKHQKNVPLDKAKNTRVEIQMKNRAKVSELTPLKSKDEAEGEDEEFDTFTTDKWDAFWSKYCCGDWYQFFKDLTNVRFSPQKVEPKLFFANERTFMKWLHMAVLLASTSIGVLAFTPADSQAQFFALLLLPIALIFTIYPVWTYLWRSNKIRNRDLNRWDDPYGPILITCLLIVALVVEFSLKIEQYVLGL